MAAILGGEFDFETLKSATGFDEETLINALESAVRAQLITEVQTNPAAPRFGFVHVLIPNTLRESMIHVRRRQFHQRAARAIEAVQPDDFEALAYHYAEAGENDPPGVILDARAIVPSKLPRVRPPVFTGQRLIAGRIRTRAGRADLLARLGYCLWVIGDVTAASSTMNPPTTL